MSHMALSVAQLKEVVLLSKNARGVRSGIDQKCPRILIADNWFAEPSRALTPSPLQTQINSLRFIICAKSRVATDKIMEDYHG